MLLPLLSERNFSYPIGVYVMILYLYQLQLHVSYFDNRVSKICYL